MQAVGTQRLQLWADIRVDTTLLGEGRCSDILGIHDSECRLCKFVPENLGGSLVVLI